MEVTVHTKRGFSMEFNENSNGTAWVDIKWDSSPNEMTFFVPGERREDYRRAVEAFTAALGADAWLAHAY